MMTLSTNGVLAVHRPGRTIVIETVTLASQERALIDNGHSATVARAAVAGDLAVRVRAIDLARAIGLLAPTDTTEARAAGLIK